jgi:DNA-directed RNA polymerase subunit RPC12/RpoP
MGSHACITGAAMKDSNDKPPYRHSHTVCAACGKVTLARPCKVPGDIERIEHNPVIRCQHCEDTRQYLDKDCFLAPLSAVSLGGGDQVGGKQRR